MIPCNWNEVWESKAVANGGADRREDAHDTVEGEGRDMFAQASLAAE